ncbi:MAG: hypothetical protein KDI14_02575 [Halioglobus sp.]|nr:hypothetical protein [Halioglobus sp.]
MSVYEFSDVAVSGVATVDNIGWFAKEYQVEVHAVSGSGVVTFKVKTPASGAYSPMDGSVSLSDSAAPRILTFKGRVTGVQAESDNAADDYTLTVTPLE